VFHIEVKELDLSEEKRQLLVISDITFILHSEKSKVQHNFQQQLTASLSHEQMTPLNAILNITDILQNSLKDEVLSGNDMQKIPASGASTQNHNMIVRLKKLGEDHKQFYEFSRIIWSSAQTLQLMITSQMSHTRININEMFCNFKPLTSPMCELFTDFMQPFFHSLKQKNITVEVAEANLIPHWVCSDWTLYKQILFHVLQNAIKFNSDGGCIKIVASYHSFEEEFNSSYQESNVIAMPNDQSVRSEPLSKIDE